MNHTATTSLQAKFLQVEFSWVGDRIGHSILWVRDGTSKVLWHNSLSDDLGPVFQELHQQPTENGGNVVFLSGAGGGAHWSMSVHVEGGMLCFDVAARLTKAPYGRSIEYVSISSDSTTAKFKPLIQSTVVDCQQSIVRVALASDGEPALPATLRWKYAVLPMESA